MRVLFVAAALAGLLILSSPPTAEACGGFFCGQQPVDQTAERVVFAVNGDGTTTMIVQISYLGAAADFAWVVPIAEVPVEGSLKTFPQLALTGLDAQTGPVFQQPDDPDCYGFWAEDDLAAAGGDPSPEERGDVEVHLREEVGPYDVAVISSDDPEALVDWLRDNEYRVTTPMEPYVALYAEAGMKFLALKLLNDADVSDIAPFQMNLPGTSPTLPLQMTALAAEPEMSIVVFVLGGRRYDGANWASVDIAEEEILWEAGTWPMRTNYAALVAKAVDAAGGQGWITEFAGSLDPLRELASNPVGSPEQEEAQVALLELFGEHQHVTRLYTRLSAEEMTSDPVFRQTDGGPVERVRQLHRYVEGRDMCDIDWGTGFGEDAVRPTTACDFVTCGAGGRCEITMTETGPVAGCACVPGATARTTFDPSGVPTVVCQDMRLSFLNPGDVDRPGATPLPDPCVGFECGAGSCVSMNMTPTCVCDRGLVAIGWIDDVTGARRTECRAPVEAVPEGFYDVRLPALPTHLPGGRTVDTPTPGFSATGGGGCSVQPGAGAGSLLALLGLVALVRRRRA